MAKLHGKLGAVQLAASPGTPVTGETPTGVVDGNNTTFTTANQNVDLVTAYVNAVEQDRSAWVVSPKGVIEFVVAPALAVTCDYTYYAMDATDAVNGFFSWTLDDTADTPECTSFEDDGVKAYLVGGREWSGAAEKYMDTSASQTSKSGTRGIVKFWLDDTANYRYEGWGLFSAVSTTVAVDGIVQEPMTFQGTEGLYLETT